MKLNTLRFGIPSLDRLLGRTEPKAEYGFGCPSDASASLCLIGRHGTGKSLLALHLASRYLADYLKNTPRVFYVSTDLSFSMADDLWRHFALGLPSMRQVPFQVPFVDEKADRDPIKIRLQRRTAHTGETSDSGGIKDDLALAKFLAGCSRTKSEHTVNSQQLSAEISFLDLVAASAGDDWGFIHRLIGVLPQPSKEQPRHLIIVDAVEGLETRIGDRDAFGEPTSRRARIAQLLRTASGKCHVVLVAEEPSENQRIPEEFLSDVVIRLRSVQQHGFQRRMIQVEKVRGQSHVRGQHPYVIRSGEGSSTRMQSSTIDSPLHNPDDPMIKMPTSNPRAEREQQEDTQAYFHVIHSLHLLTRDMEPKKPPANPKFKRGFAGFGILHLDSMLGHDDKTTGLPRSTVTALVGDAGTHKSALGKAFLSQGLAQQEIAILLTTDDIDAGALASIFANWAGGHESDEEHRAELVQSIIAELVQSIICRRIQTHSQTSEEFIHIVDAAIKKAHELLGDKPHDSELDKHERSGRIRLVIDDFSVLRSMYADIREDPLFVPFLVSYLKRQGVTALIIDTHAAHPHREHPTLFEDELQALADNHLLTWRVHFHGAYVTAISVIPPICCTDTSKVRELLADSELRRPPQVDRRLELYTGLEQDNPQQVPLEVRLYAETEVLRSYLAEMNALLAEFYHPVDRNGKGQSELVVAVEPHGYSTLHDFCNLQSERFLDHTLILQVDEFWALSPPVGHPWDIHSPSSPLRAEKDYLQGTFYDIGNDPKRSPADATLLGEKRSNAFSSPGYPLRRLTAEAEIDEIDRIPLMWDFGFLLCRKEAWERVREATVEVGDRSQMVNDIWSKLPWTEGQLDSRFPNTMQNSGDRRATWREFLGACQVVSKNQLPPFDLSIPSGESLSCLLLEIWASEIVETLLSKNKGDEAIQFIKVVSRKHWTTPRNSSPDGLIEWLRNPSKVLDFYMSWLLLVDVLSFERMITPGYPLKFADHACSPTAVASRHWYKTGCEQLRTTEQEPMFVAGLPGHFSMRGDWFLGVARGSKSDLLADRVLDLFSTRRNNFTRLYQGIGLPARTLAGEKEDMVFVTALHWKDGKREPRTVRYGQLVSLGETPACSDASRFYWLWRSALRDYHKHSRIFQRWNSHTVRMWSAFKADEGTGWKPGFAIYDELRKQLPSTNDEMDKRMSILTGKDENTWTIFRKRCDLLLKLLEGGEPTSENQVRANVVAA